MQRLVRNSRALQWLLQCLNASMSLADCKFTTRAVATHCPESNAQCSEVQAPSAPYWAARLPRLVLNASTPTAAMLPFGITDWRNSKLLRTWAIRLLLDWMILVHSARLDMQSMILTLLSVALALKSTTRRRRTSRMPTLMCQLQLRMQLKIQRTWKDLFTCPQLVLIPTRSPNVSELSGLASRR